MVSVPDKAQSYKLLGSAIGNPFQVALLNVGSWPTFPVAAKRSVRRNPDIDSNLNKPNAPIPSHTGLTWVSTSGMDAYDTPSGDLESGDYAQESDASYISNIPAYTYTDATSSVPIAAHIATSKTDPASATQ